MPGFPRTVVGPVRPVGRVRHRALQAQTQEMGISRTEWIQADFSGPFHDGGGQGAQTHGTIPAVREQRSVTVVQQDPADFRRGRFAAFRADPANGEIGQSFIQMREPDPCPAGFYPRGKGESEKTGSVNSSTHRIPCIAVFSLPKISGFCNSFQEYLQSFSNEK